MRVIKLHGFKCAWRKCILRNKIASCQQAYFLVVSLGNISTCAHAISESQCAHRQVHFLDTSPFITHHHPSYMSLHRTSTRFIRPRNVRHADIRASFSLSHEICPGRAQAQAQAQIHYINLCSPHIKCMDTTHDIPR